VDLDTTVLIHGERRARNSWRARSIFGARRDGRSSRQLRAFPGAVRVGAFGPARPYGAPSIAGIFRWQRRTRSWRDRRDALHLQTKLPGAPSREEGHSAGRFDGRLDAFIATTNKDLHGGRGGAFRRDRLPPVVCRSGPPACESAGHPSWPKHFLEQATGLEKSVRAIGRESPASCAPGRARAESRRHERAVIVSPATPRGHRALLPERARAWTHSPFREASAVWRNRARLRAGCSAHGGKAHAAARTRYGPENFSEKMATGGAGPASGPGEERPRSA